MIRRVFSSTERIFHSIQTNNDASLNISARSNAYFSDISDHIRQLVEELESLEDSCKSMIDLTYNSLAHSTNESMKTLAVVSLVFLPLTFLCGIFGMNFDYFPELHFEIGFWYFWVLVILTLIFVAAMIRFYRLY